MLNAFNQGLVGHPDSIDASKAPHSQAHVPKPRQGQGKGRRSIATAVSDKRRTCSRRRVLGVCPDLKARRTPNANKRPELNSRGGCYLKLMVLFWLLLLLMFRYSPFVPAQSPAATLPRAARPRRRRCQPRPPFVRLPLSRGYTKTTGRLSSASTPADHSIQMGYSLTPFPVPVLSLLSPRPLRLHKDKKDPTQHRLPRRPPDEKSTYTQQGGPQASAARHAYQTRQARVAPRLLADALRRPHKC